MPNQQKMIEKDVYCQFMKVESDAVAYSGIYCTLIYAGR